MRSWRSGLPSDRHSGPAQWPPSGPLGEIDHRLAAAGQIDHSFGEVVANRCR